MIKTQYIKLRVATIKEKHTDEMLKRPPILSQQEKEARIYEAAKRLGVKIGGAK